MHEHAARLARQFLTADRATDREFEARLVETSTLAFRVAFSVLRHREDAEDVAQEAFAKAHRSFRQLRDRERFRAWLVRTTWRTALDRQRANRRRVAHELAAEPAALAIASDAVAGRERRSEPDQSAALWAAIDTLPRKLRITLVLAAIEGHDMAEVAALLGIPAGTVKSRLSLARERLRRALR